jgi:TonB family protein
MNEITDLPAPSGNLGSAPAFTPYEVAPALQNRAEASQIVEGEYPAMFRDAGIAGTVVVHVFIEPNGLVGNAAVANSSGQVQLDEAALRAIRKFEFSPALIRGQPTAVWVAIPVTFRLP